MRSLLLIGTLLAPPATAQELVVSLTDGTQLVAEIAKVIDVDGEPGVVLATESGDLELRLAQLLSVHGVPPVATGPVEVRLVGGDRIRGELRGGDDAGETFTVVTPTLGKLSVPVDRLDVLVFRDRVPLADVAEFRLSDDSASDEAWFRRAYRGFDATLGGIDRFVDRGLLFQPLGADSAAVVDYSRICAITLHGGIPREDTPTTLLSTRTGDTVGVRLVAADGQRLTVELEDGRRVALEAQNVSAMTFLGDDRVFLSDLEPKSVEESSFFGEGDEPLLPFQLDREVKGGSLVVGGRCYGKGLGVHSKSVLGFEVPAGMSRFHAQVGIDDSVLELPVRGDVTVQVRVGDEVLWSAESLRSGEKPLNLGVLPVTPGTVLTLEVDFGKGLDLGDRVDWLGPVFLR